MDSRRLLQVSHAKEMLIERLKLRNFPWTRTEKDNALTKCRLGLRVWRSKKPMLSLHVVTDEDGNPLENEDDSGRWLCECWSAIFEARVEGEGHHGREPILRYVQKAPDDRRWEIDRNEFDEFLSTKKNPLQVTMRFHIVSTGLLEDWALNSHTMRADT